MLESIILVVIASFFANLMFDKYSNSCKNTNVEGNIENEKTGKTAKEKILKRRDIKKEIETKDKVDMRTIFDFVIQSNAIL